MPIVTIIQLGADPSAMEARRLVLEQALPGCILVNVTSSDELTPALRQVAFDIAVLDANLDDIEKRRLTALVRSHSPKTRLLELVAGPPATDADLALDFSRPLDEVHLFRLRTLAGFLR